MNTLFKAFSGLLISLLFTSCQSYLPLPLEPEEILKEVDQARQFKATKKFSFDYAAQLMSERNQALKLLKIDYKKYKDIADISTPLPNPSLEFGPAFGSHIDGTNASTTQPFVGLGFSIPLGPRLARNDDLNKAKELQAYNNIVIQHRQLYFDLRKAYVNYFLAQQSLQKLKKITATLNTTKKITEKLIEIGTSTKLGLTQVKLQIAHSRLQQLELQSELNTALGKISRLTNIELSSLSGFNAKEIKLKPIDINLADLKEVLLKNNLLLAQEEMEFHIADHELKLEISEQYPDLNVGISAENEVGEKKRTLSIPFSIELPVFDQNKQSISAATSNRNIKLENYKKAVSEQISYLEENLNTFQHEKKKADITQKQILPLVQEHIQDAEKALRFGAIDILRYLDLIIQGHQFQLDSIEHKKALWANILKLENLSGLPLIKFTENDLDPLNISTQLMVK